jgi:hypothetical protein
VRNAFLLFAAGLAAPLALALPVTPARLSVAAVDAQTGKALDGAVVGATESVYYTGFHSSHTECFRAAATLAANGKATVSLPAAMMPTQGADNRTVEVFAFRKGYCAERPYAAASTAGFIKWANREDPQGLWGKVDNPKPGDAVTLRLARSDDEPERRLRHLALVSRRFAYSCHEAGGDFMAPVREAMLTEARAIARTDYEKELASQVERAWQGDRVPIRVVTVNPDAPPPDPNLRAADGLTKLMRAARDMLPDEVKKQLAAGARADVVTGPDGYSALDLVLSRAAKDVAESRTAGQEIHMGRMIALLVAARPAPTMRAEYREALADPARWTVTPHLREFWMQVREQVMPLAARPRYAARCAIDEPGLRSLPLIAPPGSR